LAYYFSGEKKPIEDKPIEKVHKCKTNNEKLAQGQDDEEFKKGVGSVVDGVYHLNELVGLGGYGIVYLASGPIKGKKYAVKIMRNRSEELLESLA